MSRKMPSSHWSLDGRRAIVTGGSKGLGRAIVEELLAQGCEVITCARDLAPLGPLLASETRLSAVEVDVSTEEGRATLIDAMRARFGAECALDILVNNVGTNIRKPSVDYSPDEFNDLMSTNAASALHLSTACQPNLVRARGSVVQISSVSGSHNDHTGVLYHMSKVHEPPPSPRAPPSTCHRARPVHVSGGNRAHDAVPRRRVGPARRARQRGRAVVRACAQRATCHLTAAVHVSPRRHGHSRPRGRCARRSLSRSSLTTTSTARWSRRRRCAASASRTRSAAHH